MRKLLSHIGRVMGEAFEIGRRAEASAQDRLAAAEEEAAHYRRCAEASEQAHRNGQQHWAELLDELGRHDKLRRHALLAGLVRPMGDARETAMATEWVNKLVELAKQAKPEGDNA